MKRYIVASKRYVEQPMDRLYSELGISRWSDDYKLVNTSSGKHNFYITKKYYTLDPEEIADLKSRIRNAGGKYIEPKHGNLYFFIDMDKFKEAYEAESKQAEDDYNAELGEIDITSELEGDNLTPMKPPKQTSKVSGILHIEKCFFFCSISIL